MFAYKGHVLGLLDGRAECHFVRMPEDAPPDWGRVQQGVPGWPVLGFHPFLLRTRVDVARTGTASPWVRGGDTWGIYINLIETLSRSGAFLVGCTTTPVRGNMPGYEGGVDWTYGSRFKQMLGPKGVKINDLADYTRTRPHEMLQENSNLPTALGAQLMAEQVANSLREAFNEGQDPDRPRILIVGDSIVGGYYGAVRNRFAGVAAVYSGGTTYNDAEPDWENHRE